MRAGTIAVLMFAATLRAPALEQEFADLETAKGSFTNTFITGQSDTHVFFQHNGGKAAIRIRDLDAAGRAFFGIASSRPAPAAGAPTRLAHAETARTAPVVASTSTPTPSAPAAPTAIRMGDLPVYAAEPSPVLEGSGALVVKKSPPAKSLRPPSLGMFVGVAIFAGLAALGVVVLRKVFSGNAAVAKGSTAKKPAAVPRPAGGGQDVRGRCTMSEEAEKYLQEKYEQQFPFRAAKYSVVAPGLLLATAYFARSVPQAESQLVLCSLAGLFMATGFFFGAYALWNIRKLGPRKLLPQGLAGVLINGFFILTVLTSFDRIKHDLDNARYEKARAKYVWDPLRKP